MVVGRLGDVVHAVSCMMVGMTPRIIVGIDPGANGALAALECSSGDLVAVVDLPYLGGGPDAVELAAILEALAPPSQLYVVVEEPIVTAVKGRRGLATQFTGFGVLLGTLAVIGAPHSTIQPREWQTAVGLPMSTRDKKITYREKKKNSMALARQQWPQQRYRNDWKHDGRAEAALIAEAGRRTVTPLE